MSPGGVGVGAGAPVSDRHWSLCMLQCFICFFKDFMPLPINFQTTEDSRSVTCV